MIKRDVYLFFLVLGIHLTYMHSCKSAGSPGSKKAAVSDNKYSLAQANLENSQLRYLKPGSKIAAFWTSTIKRLSEVPMEAKVLPIAEPVPYRKFKVTLRSLHGVIICALLSMPVQGEATKSKIWPVIVTTPGYGGAQQGIMLGECQRGYAILQVYPRGQGESSEYYKIVNDKLTGHLDTPEGAYYQGAYADVIRMIDFVTSRTDLDANRVALAGTSQGGGIALAVAALDSRVKVVVAHVPFLCNFRLAAQTPSLVKKLLDQAAANNEASLNTLDYFDPYQPSSKIHIPVLMSAGGKDDVCPEATIRSVYNKLPGKKTLKYYPELKHTSCVDFYNLSWLWLDKHFLK